MPFKIRITQNGSTFILKKPPKDGQEPSFEEWIFPTHKEAVVAMGDVTMERADVEAEPYDNIKVIPA